MLKTVMVGLGWWGRHIVGALDGSARIKIVGVTSHSPEKHRDFADEKGVALVPSYEAALADGDIDAVILCTPHSQHEEQVLAALAAGKQVFCEKPLALSKSSAEKMIAAATDAGVILGIGHERRFEPAMEEIARLAASGELGTHMHVEANFSHDILTRLESDSWRAAAEEAPAAGMTGMGVHLTDLFIAMFGPVEAVCASTASRVLDLPSGDLVTVQFRFASGATGFLSAISATPYYGRFTLFGDQMWVEARDEGHPQHGGKTQLITCGKDGVQHSRVFEAKDPVRANLEEWAAAVAGEGSYRFTDAEKLGNVAILEAVARSVESGGWEQVSRAATSNTATGKRVCF